jgi:hypothetical protein
VSLLQRGGSDWIEQARIRDQQNRIKVTRESEVFVTKLANRISALANVRVEKRLGGLDGGLVVHAPRTKAHVNVVVHMEHSSGASAFTVTGRFSVRAQGKLWRARATWGDALIGEIAAHTVNALERVQAEERVHCQVDAAVREGCAAVESAGLAAGDVHVNVYSSHPYTTMSVEVRLPDELTVAQAIVIARFARTVLSGGDC